MKIKGTIKHALEVRSGISQKTGNSWMSQQFVMEYLDTNQNTKLFLFSIFGEEALKSVNLKEGDEVAVEYNPDAHEYNGRWFGDNRAEAVLHLDKTSDTAPSQGAGDAEPAGQDGFDF